MRPGESLGASSAHLLHIWLLLLALSDDLCPDVVPHLSRLGRILLLCPRLGYDLFSASGSCHSS